MKLAVLAITPGGKKLARTIAGSLTDCTFLDDKEKVSEKLAGNWHKYEGFICIMAAGIVVRTIAPLLVSKKDDPCVVVLDELGNHIISLVSGHLGGGNALSEKIAGLTGGTAVITTSSDVQNLTPLDLWAEQQNLTAHGEDTLTKASSLLVNRTEITLFCESTTVDLPQGLTLHPDRSTADIIVGHTTENPKQLLFHPRNIVVGVGCNRGTPLEEFEQAISELFAHLAIPIECIRNLASIDAKNDETGLLAFAEQNNWTIDFFSKEQINMRQDVEISHAALKAVGAIGVAEPTALLSAGTPFLLSRKRKWHNITMAVAAAPFTLSEQVLDPLTI